MQRDAALDALERAASLGPSVDGLLDLALARQLAGDVGGEVSACEQAVVAGSRVGRSRLASGPRAGADRARRASAWKPATGRSLLGAGHEVRELRRRVREAEPRVLPQAA